MKIESVRIESFGNLRDLELSGISENLTVIYGKNEAGKSTIIEFIRSTLFPTTKRKSYPSYADTDSGVVKLRTDSGETVTVRKTKRKTETDGRPLSDLIQTDYPTYRSIYAMSPEDLRDSEAVGKIQKKFLTIPGGELVPEILEDIDKEMKTLLSSERRSQTTEIGSLMEKSKTLDAQISSLSVSDDEYTELYQTRIRTENDLKELRRKEKENEESRRKAEVKESQKSNLRNLGELNEQLILLKESKIVKDGDEETFRKLDLNIENRKLKSEELKSETEKLLLKLEGADPDALLDNKETIQNLKNDIGMYQNMTGRMAIPEQENSRPRTNSSIVPPAILAVGLIMTVAGLFVNILISVAGLCVIGLGAYMFVSSRNKTPAKTANHQEYENLALRISERERELNRIAGETGIERTYYEKDVHRLYNLAAAAGEYEESMRKLDRENISLKESKLEMERFLIPFGTEERFQKLNADRKKRIDLEKRIKTLEDSIKSSGYDPDAQSADEISDFRNEIADLNRTLGEIETRMKNILNDRERESLMNRKAEVESEIVSKTKRWAVLSLSRKIVNDVCDDLFETVRPGVIETADAYLSMMTGGRYRMNSDPRDPELSVISEDGKKKESEWSTGLEDQVKLSLKMAVAKELSGESLPMILDDVLLTFDTDRKTGACKALTELSEKIQILYFTCDSETRDILISEECNDIVSI